jgi:hypothetical protein
MLGSIESSGKLPKLNAGSLTDANATALNDQDWGGCMAARGRLRLVRIPAAALATRRSFS